MYSDIFESATFSFWIQKFHHAHVIGFVAELLFSTVEDGLKKKLDSRDVETNDSGCYTANYY